jgi:diguanylate cyclase (GGDEF)-like protein
MNFLSDLYPTNEQFLLFLAIFMVAWIGVIGYYRKRHRIFIESFLDSTDNISIITNSRKITNINKKGLSFFGSSSVDDFNASYFSVASLFIEEDGCLGKHSFGKNWFQKIENNKDDNIKVKLLNQENKEHYYFHIKVTKISYSNEYLLLFHNITKIVGEKNKIVRIAERDALTGIYNRVKFNDIFSDLIYNANRYDKDFSVILFDIDHFKHINDTYGHNVGDSVLIELTHTVKNLLRESDIFVRWGGEEFIVVLQLTSLLNAEKIALDLRKNIEERPFIRVKEVTCSFGVTEFRDGDTQMILLERVDEALYEAKENGRNRVVVK